MPTLTSVPSIETELRAGLAEVERRVERLQRGAGGTAIEVLRAYDRLLLPLNGVEGRVGLFVSAHPDAAVREACEGLEREIAELRTRLALDRKLYERLAGLDPDELPDAPARRLLAQVRRDFRRSGVDRDEPTRARVRALQEELVAIGQEFDRNIVTLGRDFVVRAGRAALAGLPADFIAAHPPRPDGTIVLSTDPHVRTAVLTYAERADLREGFYLAANTRAYPENIPVLARLLEKRHELARTLGYAHWADYVTEDKMTRSAGTARAFLERLLSLSKPRAAAEYAELLAAKRVREPEAPGVFEWERAYWLERIKKERFQCDSLAVRQYFPLERVKAGVLDTAARLFGLEFRRNPTIEVWHPSVECWELFEAGEQRARFYFDLHPRAGKFKHAAMFPIQDGLAGECLPEAVLMCNFPAPSADDPALLLHDQVTTFFHEFGHLLHHVLAGRGAWLLQAGIATERDFVEVPSQLFEEWAWDPEVLARFARHAESDEPIPRELVLRLRAAEDYGKGLTLETQLFFGLLALDYYERPPAGRDLTQEMIALKRRLLSLPHTEGSYFHASFGHLNGYSALYYTYLWSLVIAKDCLSEFQPDLMNTAAALRYRRAVLEPGGSQEAEKLVRGFLGRAHSFEAFERWLAE
jgi:thimet oligopeptidase